ncbi:MAG TPA: hypothetical protein ENK18_24555 [Deltaproteobacteria bacterium]|nr:hypothetical protein [Deltaproteobacteria bacterium]
MPRRNRRKVHRELRLRAEARQQQRCALRAARRDEEARFLEALARARRRIPSPATTPARSVSTLLRSVRELLRLANVPRPLVQRVHRICTVVSDQIPALAATAQLPWFLLLAEPSWVRSPQDFRAPSGSLRRKRDALALHLFARYPVPPFLVRSLDIDPLAVARVPVEEHWAVGLLAHVGRGYALRTLVGSSLLPVPLTRRMCHLFLTATATTPPLLALRRAQVVGSGGGSALARALLRTRLGSLRGPDPLVGEPFWHEMIAWMARHESLVELGSSRLERLCGWMEASQRALLREGRTLSLSRRPLPSVMRAVDAWHALSARPVRPDSFPGSGLLPLSRGPFAITELRCEAELSEEGAQMHHCAFSYRRLLRKGKVALFSITEQGARAATVEVSLGAGRVVQAKGAFNRECTRAQLAFLRLWAEQNRLTMAL